MITAATLQESQSVGREEYKVRVRLTDDVTGVSDEWFFVNGATLAELRNDLTAQLIRRNAAKSKGNLLAGIAPGFAIPLTLAAPPGPTAKQIWLEKVSRYKIFAGMGLTGAGATALAALLADINATYATGFLDA